MSQATVYVFTSPMSREATTNVIEKALSAKGKVKVADSARGFVSGKHNRYKIEFFIEKSSTVCNVRVLFYCGGTLNRVLDNMWDKFLTELFAAAPGVDFGIFKANGRPIVSAFRFMDDATKRVYTSHTHESGSLAGFLLGNMVVGGGSGSQRTQGSSDTVFNSYRLVRIVYDNGRMYEGSISTNSNLYKEIMVNID